ncbi:MAG: vWA domain-containing protein [Chloroflexia bacterium]
MERDIQLVCTPSRKELPALDEAQLLYLLVEVEPVAPHEGEIRLPLDLCLLLDCSSSMRGDRLFQAKEAARYLVGQLSPADRFCLIAFNDRATVVVPRQPVQAPAAIREHIAEIQASGGTEMARGLEAALQQMERSGPFAGVRRLILLTDGRTYGDETRCVELARQLQQQGIGITAFGLGTEWNEDLLATIAAYGNSRSEYIVGPEAIVPLFREEMRLLQGIVAQEMSIALHPASGVVVQQFYRVAPEIAPVPLQETWDRSWVAALGEWMGAETQVFLTEVLLPPLSVGEHPLLEVTLSYRLPHESGQREKRYPLRMPCGTAEAGLIPERVRRALERLMAFRLQEAAWQEVQQGDIERATRRLRAAATRLLELGEVDLARRVEEEARQLHTTGLSSTSGKKAIRYGTKRLGRFWFRRSHEDGAEA